MKRILTFTLVLLLLCGLGACGAREASGDLPSDRETASAPPESPAETQTGSKPAEAQTELRTESDPAETQAEPQTEPETAETQTEPQTEPEPAESQTEPGPAETQTEPRARNETEMKTVSLTLPYMETEDFFSFQPEAGEESAGLSLRVPADWTEDAGLFYCPMDGGVRKVLEPVCLLRALDDARWDALVGFDVTGEYGETEYLSVVSGVDANGREYIQLLGKSWPEGDGTISVWYPCFCFLRDTTGATAVLTYYLLDPEDPAAQAELGAILDSIRLD